MKDKSRKETDCVCTYSIIYVYVYTHIQKHTYIKNKQILMTILISVTRHVIIAGIYYYLLPTYSAFPLPLVSISLLVLDLLG